MHPTALRPAPSHWAFRRVLRFSLPQTLTTMLLYIMLWTDILLLGRLGAAGEVAVYRVAQNLLSPAQTISTSTGQMFAPRIAAEDARGDHATLGLMLKRVTYWNIALSLPVFLVLLLLPRPLLGLFGPRYEAGATALVILAAGQLFNAATGPLGQVINMSGRPYVTMANNAAVAALNIVGCVILIPRYGITGAACSTTASITLVNLIKLVQVRVHLRDQPVPAAGRCGRSAQARSPRRSSRRSRSSGRGRRTSSRCWRSGRCSCVLYAVLFWTLAAGDEERALIRRRRRGGRPPWDERPAPEPQPGRVPPPVPTRKN